MPKLRQPDVVAVLGKARTAALREAETRLRAFATQQRDAFVARIQAQDFESFRQVPLSWRWQSRKQAMRLDDRTMIATGAYLRSIQVFETRKGGLPQFRIGIHPNVIVRHPLTGAPRRIPMWLLACVHEFGSHAAKVPARPHWGPFFAELAHVVAPRTAREMVQACGKRVRQAIGGRP